MKGTGRRETRDSDGRGGTNCTPIAAQSKIMVQKNRIFDGETYQFHAEYATKGEAKKEQDRLKGSDLKFLVRIIPAGAKWRIYYRMRRYSSHTKKIKGRDYQYTRKDGKETYRRAADPAHRKNKMDSIGQHCKHVIIQKYLAGDSVESIQFYLKLIEGIQISRTTLYNYFAALHVTTKRTAKKGPAPGKKYHSSKK